MDTKQTVWIYAISTLILLIDCILMDFGIEYALMMMVLFLLPALGISALLVLICVMLWKKSVQLSKDDIFFFVVYNTAFPYEALAIVLLIIMLFGNGWLNALLMIIGNFVFVKLCHQKFLKWFELQNDEHESFAIGKGVLSVTALQIVLFLALNIWLQYSI